LLLLLVVVLSWGGRRFSSLLLTSYTAINPTRPVGVMATPRLAISAVMGTPRPLVAIMLSGRAGLLAILASMSGLTLKFYENFINDIPALLLLLVFSWGGCRFSSLLLASCTAINPTRPVGVMATPRLAISAVMGTPRSLVAIMPSGSAGLLGSYRFTNVLHNACQLENHHLIPEVVYGALH
jgi:hypothetical protein